MRPPATMRILRPLRSAYLPASGWATRTIGLTAATASATPKLPTPSSSSAYTGTTARSAPTDRQSANSVSIASTKVLVTTRSICTVRSKHNAHSPPRQEQRVRTRIECRMPTRDTELRAEARREAAPAVTLVLVVLGALAFVSHAEGWELLGLPWWIWLALALPALLLTVDLLLA